MKVCIRIVSYISALFLLNVQMIGSACEINNVEVYVKSNLGAGFFAELRNAMATIIQYDELPCKRLVVDWTQEFFPYKDAPSSNGWDLYFEFKKQDSLGISNQRKQERHHHVLHDQNCIDRWVHYERYLPYRLYVHKKFNEYIRIKQAILDEGDQFFIKHMYGHFCIGVHVRFASAHTHEGPGGRPVVLEHYIQEARALYNVHLHKNPRVFVASDSNYVIEQFKKAFSPSVVVFTDAFRASYNQDPHLIYERADYYRLNPAEFHKNKPGYFGGKTALIDCLLLSRCDVMIHSQSNVCEWATFFNPYITSIFLPKGVSSWPCQFPNAPFHVVKP